MKTTKGRKNIHLSVFQTQNDKEYSLRFILVVVLGLCTQIKKTFNFTYFQNKNTITNTPNHISTNRKIE